MADLTENALLCGAPTAGARHGAGANSPSAEALHRVETACPACGGGAGRVRFVVNSRQAAYHFAVAEAEPERFAALERYLDHLWHGDGCRVIECVACRFCFADPFVAGDSEFYRLAFPRHGYPRDRWEFGVTAAEIAQLAARSSSPPELRLLEVGAGDGAFIRQVCPAVLRWENIVCTEYSKSGKEALRSLGIKCLATDIREITEREYEGLFHFVCMFQVVEHMDRLDDLFEHLRWLTAADGSVFISVPSERIIEFYERHGCLLDMPPNHLGRWNAKAFTLIAERHGWRVAAHAYSPRRFLPLYQRVAIYRHMRQSQRSGTLSNRVAAIVDPSIRRLAEIAVIAGHAIGAAALIPKLLSSELGDSQRVRLVKR